MNFITKQIILVRNDIKLSRGKLAVQVAHGAVMASELTRQHNEEMWKVWIGEGYPKIVLKVDSLHEMLRYKTLAEMNGVLAYEVIDFGLTELPPNTKTCMAIGPDYVEKLAFTKDLRLL